MPFLLPVYGVSLNHESNTLYFILFFGMSAGLTHLIWMLHHCCEGQKRYIKYEYVGRLPLSTCNHSCLLTLSFPFLALAILVLWLNSYLNILIAVIQLYYIVTCTYVQKYIIEDLIKNWRNKIISEMEYEKCIHFSVWQSVLKKEYLFLQGNHWCLAAKQGKTAVIWNQHKNKNQNV